MKRLSEVIGLAPSEDENYLHRLQNERTRISGILANLSSFNQRSVKRTVAPKMSQKTVVSELQKEMDRLGIKSVEELEKLLGGAK